MTHLERPLGRGWSPIAQTAALLPEILGSPVREWGSDLEIACSFWSKSPFPTVTTKSMHRSILLGWLIAGIAVWLVFGLAWKLVPVFADGPITAFLDSNPFVGIALGLPLVLGGYHGAASLVAGSEPPRAAGRWSASWATDIAGALASYLIFG